MVSLGFFLITHILPELAEWHSPSSYHPWASSPALHMRMQLGGILTSGGLSVTKLYVNVTANDIDDSHTSLLRVPKLPVSTPA